ncbi:MAG: 16S rRNA (adenine(1518)-N(6)/adenine(1519)-N(6))-dimethyltransferase RsmA [Rhodospirillaceae bacterium]|nr:16S rRNA (adenine(1518)-N(6)/adenine(1519)-N(6))-dimethyltransferase RsmA [Rhodospirillaceae bacterium]MBT5083309.1 16S rRNA (adenine(1518)-N(6)/adenine(1519)-N(6))-dimethyltransferase RsmA [Rhodospirillaceae bacterium]MBT5526201.1 16S rRNA (adenine(1518)-N(6)/adenine(1519)-N(6))-dimethyltransferase RsmA [Rhodospirillaceae bacterium]MBT5882283.1 16S rRNA (adenine(1518)-N(6)/adenine(1519)-N(6))-dimethyltransferase RsmA [Rhodospirillaceae bacterium]MBT6589154.1 16S rRNA (adenine(1518)-N(6)/ade
MADDAADDAANGSAAFLEDLPPLRDVLAAHEIRATKTLGQNFLLDLNLTRKIARAGGSIMGKTVLEIGAGPGGLTRALLAEGAGHVVAIERDRRCLAALEELAAVVPGRLTLVEGDALEVDEYALTPRPSRIVANLPYNISTPLLFKWLDRLDLFESMTLMFQKEVAQRIIAPPGGKTYGRLSVMVQWRCAATALFDLPPRAFTPAPKVTSTVIGLTPLVEPRAPADAAILERVVAAAFGQRRKMLRASLKQVSSDPLALLAAAGLEPTLRAENLSVEQFCALARAAT